MIGLGLTRRKESVISCAHRAGEAADWQLAARLYGKVLQRNPRNPPIWVQYGHALKEMGRMEAAEAAYRRAIAYDPRAADSYLQLGHVLKLQGRTGQATSAYLRAFALDGSLIDPARELAALGWSEARLAELKEAVGFDAGVPDRPDGSISGAGRRRSRESLITRADRAREHSQWEMAARLYGKALQRNPRNPAIWVQYGHALKESGRLADAEKAYRSAISYEPRHVDGYLQLGHALKLQDNTEEAQSAYLRAFLLDPSAAAPLYELGGLGWSTVQLSNVQTMVTNDLAGEDGSCHSSDHRVAERIDRSDTIGFTIAVSGLFDPEWYLSCNPDVAGAGVDPFDNFMSHGWKEGRDPHPLFDTDWYLSRNPDVAAAGVNPLAHYLSRGAAKGCDPHPLFDTNWYLSNTPEVASSRINPLVHYLTVGAAMGYDPNPLFDTDWYLQENPETRSVNPLVHYLLVGAAEGRDPNPLFNSRWYLVQNPEVGAAGTNPLLHYITIGAFQGRDPNPLFDSDWYLAQNPEVAAADLNPLHHYLSIGAAQGLNPSPTFDGTAYEKLNPDLSFVVQNPLATYLRQEQLDLRYQLRVRREQQFSIFELPWLQQHVTAMLYRPRFVIYIEGSDSIARQQTTSSLSKQLYRLYEICEGPELKADTPAVPTSPEFLIWLDAGDILHRSALYELASVINAEPSVDVIYSDEDQITNGCRMRPFFKPDWSPDYLESINYIGSIACFRNPRAKSIQGKSSSYYDFVLRFTEERVVIKHIRKVLLHRPATNLFKLSPHKTSLHVRALKGRLQRTGRKGEVTPFSAATAAYNIRLTLTGSPKVSIVIPTAGKIAEVGGRQIDFISNCIDTIFGRSTYKNIEIIVVHNNNLSARRLEHLLSLDCKLVAYVDGDVNIPRKLNIGAATAAGDMLVLLNDDIEIISSDWMERLLEHFQKPHVGVVGPKLLYASGRIQHSGVVLNSSHPDHVGRLRDRNDIGYFFSGAVPRNFIAVTGAAMMTRKEVFDELGGYEELLPISYNDVDYCFKVLERGLTAVYDPRVELTHFESQSREPSLDPAEAKYFANRWASTVTKDPFYNENELTVCPPTFAPQYNSRII